MKSGGMTFAEAVHEGLYQAMLEDSSVICYGLGATDPKGVFGTTSGLEMEFGSRRVFDMPTAENAMTGIAIGAALGGLRPVMIHQRLDFFLLAMDQLVNNAAKWHYMFNGICSVPLTIRLIIGRGWGQGPTHAQNLQAWFAHIPGLKVVMPAFPDDAYALLRASIQDPNPVLFLENRWLYGSRSVVSEYTHTSLGKARIVQKGDAVTVVSYSYLTLEALRAAQVLGDQGVYMELIDLRTVAPIDWECIASSLRRTGRLLVLDTGHTTGSVAAEIIARISTNEFVYLKKPPLRIALPDVPEPTSRGLVKGYYPTALNIAEGCLSLLDTDASVDLSELFISGMVDTPGEWFKGPF
jgi:acetoin:2,6-dichlorophenolindophenol oxidoreductase subunit beta